MENQFTYNLTKLWNYPKGVFMIDGHRMRAFVIPKNSKTEAFKEIVEISFEKPWLYCLIDQDSNDKQNLKPNVQFGSTNRLLAKLGHNEDKNIWSKAVLFYGHSELMTQNNAVLVKNELNNLHLLDSGKEGDNKRSPAGGELDTHLSVLVNIYKDEILRILSFIGLDLFDGHVAQSESSTV